MRNVNQILENKSAAVVTVAKDAPVLDVIRLMAEHHIGSVLIVEAGRLVGIATERDYARKVILQGRSSSDTPVAQIMSSPVVSVSPETTAQTCMQIMTDRRIQHRQHQLTERAGLVDHADARALQRLEVAQHLHHLVVVARHRREEVRMVLHAQ